MEKILKTDCRYECKFLQLYEHTVETEDGHEAKRLIVKKADAVVVVPVIDDCIVLIKQFRLPAGAELWELPAGHIDEGEEPLSAAIRETEEEIGFKVDDIVFLGEHYASAGFTTEKVFLFKAKLGRQTAQHLDFGENLTVHFLKEQEVLDKLNSGEIKALSSAMALSNYFLNKR